MSKPSSRGPAAEPKDESAPVTRLDEKITQLTINTAKAVQRHRNAVLAITALVIVAILGVWGYREVVRAQQRALSGRVFQLFRSRGAEKLSITGAEPAEISRMLADIRALTADAGGTDSERWVIKEAVDYLIDKARDQVFPPSDDGNPYALRPAGESEKKDPAPPSPEVLGAAEELVREAREKFPDDRDLQHWAEQSARSIQALSQWKIQAPTRPFRPVLPPAEDAGPGGAPAPPPQEPEQPGTSK